MSYIFNLFSVLNTVNLCRTKGKTLQRFKISLKGHGNEADFLGFLQKLVPHRSLTLPFEPFRFRLRICRDIHIQKTTPRYHRYGESPTPRISGTGSRQLPASLIRGVSNFPHTWYAESATPRITDTDNSPYRWVGESPTPLITDMESQGLRVSLSRGVDNSEDQWYGESLFKEKIIWCRFSELLMAKPCL
jgi:hypothetical protein